MKKWLFMLSTVLILAACSSTEEKAEGDTVDSSSKEELNLNLLNLNEENDVPEGDANISENIKLQLDMFVGDYLDSYLGHDISRMEGMMLPSSEIYLKHVKFFENNVDRVFNISSVTRSYKKINDNKYQVINGEIHVPDNTDEYKELLILSVYTVELIDEKLYITNIEQNLVADDAKSIDKWVIEQKKLEEARSNSQQSEKNMPTSASDEDSEGIESDLIDRNDEFESELNYLIDSYLFAYTNGDVDSLGYFVDSSSKFYNQQLEYVESLNSRGITVNLIDYNIVSIEPLSEKKYQVIVDEQFSIDNPNKGISDVTQTSIYTVQLINGETYITNLEVK